MSFFAYKNNQGQWEYFEAPNTVKTVAQELTDEQKALARNNIGLGDVLNQITQLNNSIDGHTAALTSINNEIDSLKQQAATINTQIETIHTELEKRPIIYISSSEPTDAAIGTLWLNTSNDIIYGEEVKF